jgi:hypothetical protein
MAMTKLPGWSDLELPKGNGCRDGGASMRTMAKSSSVSVFNTRAPGVLGIARRDFDGLGVAHDMRVRGDVALTVNQEAGSNVFLGRVLPRRL